MKTKILTHGNTKKKIYLLPFTILIVFLFSSLEMKCNYDVIWTDTTTGTYGFSQAKFSPNGQYIAVSQKNDEQDTSVKGRILILNSSNGQIIRTLYHKTRIVNSLVFLNDSLLASSDTWGLPDTSKRTSIRIWNILTGQNIQTLMAYDSAYNKFWSVDFVDCTPDGNYLFANLFTTEMRLNSHGLMVPCPPQIYVWNTQTWQLDRKIDNYLNKISPDGTYYVTYDKDICSLWDIQQDALLQQIQLHPYGGFGKLNVSPSGRFIAFLDEVDSTKIYDKLNKSFIRFWSYIPSFPDKNIDNGDLAFSRYSDYLIISGGDYDSVFVIFRQLDSNIIKSKYKDEPDKLRAGGISLEISPDNSHILSVAGIFLQLRGIDWTTTGVNLGGDGNKSSIIFPNPTDGKINIIDDNFKQGSFKIMITDESGRVIRNYIFEGLIDNENTIKLDSGNLPQGIYFLNMSNDKLSKTYKVIINK